MGRPTRHPPKPIARVFFLLTFFVDFHGRAKSTKKYFLLSWPRESKKIYFLRGAVLSTASLGIRVVALLFADDGHFHNFGATMARINSNGFTAVWAGVSADTASPGAIEQLLADNADHLSYKVVRGSDGTVTITAQMNKEKGTKYNCNASNFTFGGVQPDVETGKRRGDSAATYRDHAHWLLQLPDKNAIHQNTNYVIKLKDVKLKWADEAWDQKLLTDEWYLNLVQVVARSSYDLRVRRVQAYWSRVAAEQDEQDEAGMIERVENDSPLQPFNAESEALAGEFLKQFEKPSARHTYLILVGGNGVGKSTFAEAGVGALMVARGLATESRPFVHNSTRERAPTPFPAAAPHHRAPSPTPRVTLPARATTPIADANTGIAGNASANASTSVGANTGASADAGGRRPAGPDPTWGGPMHAQHPAT